MKFLLLVSLLLQITLNAVHPYLNSKLSPEARVSDLITRMTLKEKVGQMCQYVGFNYIASSVRGMTAEEILNSDSQADYKGFKAKDIANMVTKGEVGSFLHVLDPLEANQIQKLALRSRLKIPILIGIDAIHGNGMVTGCTVYPSPITMASSFTDDFAYKVARETALEMRSTGSHWAFTPNIDIARDPRWGRVGETFGEDPLIVSNFGSQMIRGFQLDNFTGTDRVIACAKHLIAGSEPINGLNFSPMDLSERTLREIFLKPYIRAIEAGVYTMMSAHHEVNGIPCVMNSYLMEELVRDELGFDGFFVSDWLDIERLVDLHHVAEDFKEACGYAVNAGTDMHMHGPKFIDHVISLVNEGKVAESRVNEACEKILMAKFKLGLFENPLVELEGIPESVYTEEHKSTALEIARKSIVLLKNKDRVLPYSNNSPQKLLVTGPNANNHTILGDWAINQPESNVITIYEGFRDIGSQLGHQVDFHDSNENIRAITKDDILNTVSKSKDYDHVIMVIGDNSMRHLGEKGKVSGENVARAELNLAGNQLALVQAIHSLGIPMTVVLVNGKPISEPWISDNIPAIIEAWEPGLFGGQAVAEIFFGKINPSGKLPITVPRSVGQLQMIYNHKPSQYFKKYAFESVKPLYPFGHGLSYSNFIYSNLKLEMEGKGAESNVKVSIRLFNDSKVDGDEIVQVYFRDSTSRITRPVKELVDYKRVYLPAGESTLVEFKIQLKDLAYLDNEMKYVVEAGEFIFMVGGTSSKEYLEEGSILVEKDFYY